MPEIVVNFEVWCSCGNGLCNQVEDEKHGRGFIVTPCDSCLEEKYDEGKDDGYKLGYADAKVESK